MFEKFTKHIPGIGNAIAIRSIESDIKTLERLKAVAEFDVQNLSAQLEEKREELSKLRSKN